MNRFLARISAGEGGELLCVSALAANLRESVSDDQRDNVGSPNRPRVSPGWMLSHGAVG